jgi:DNA polymerase I-like protein with 3'-5' exonuclease and polymerase domains
VRYGRLSASDPNLQQQPSPDRDREIAGEWRKIFIPEDGAIWGCNDYSQQEPRWTTHFAAVMGLDKADEAARRYRDNPDTDNHDMMTRLIYSDETVDQWFLNDPKGKYKIHRGYSKNIFLGLCYGEGGAKLCHDIGKPTRYAVFYGYGRHRQTEYFLTKTEAMAFRMTLEQGYVKEVAGEEGQQILDNFNAEVPYVGKLAKAATERASQKGFVRTILGRQLNFERRDDGTYDYTHKALNRIIQGSSADQVKLAIVQMDRAGVFLQLQVHDETDGSYATVNEAKIAGEIMRTCVLDYCEPMVPFKVDTEYGPSWGELKAA